MAIFMREFNRNGNDRVVAAVVVFRRNKVSKKSLITIYDYYVNLRTRSDGVAHNRFRWIFSLVFLSDLHTIIACALRTATMAAPLCVVSQPFLVHINLESQPLARWSR